MQNGAHAAELGCLDEAGAQERYRHTCEIQIELDSAADEERAQLGTCENPAAMIEGLLAFLRRLTPMAVHPSQTPLSNQTVALASRCQTRRRAHTSHILDLLVEDNRLNVSE
jgi:hypothetical protein